MKLRRLMAIVLVGGALATTAAACGGSDSKDTADPTATRSAATTAAPTKAVTTAATAAATAAPTSAGGAGGVTITASDFKYAEKDVKAKAGPVALFLNNTGSAPHTVTLYSDAGYTKKVAGGDTGRVAGGGTGEARLDLAKGSYFFRCEVHPGPMQGELTVE